MYAANLLQSTLPSSNASCFERRSNTVSYHHHSELQPPERYPAFCSPRLARLSLQQGHLRVVSSQFDRATHRHGTPSFISLASSAHPLFHHFTHLFGNCPRQYSRCNRPADRYCITLKSNSSSTTSVGSRVSVPQITVRRYSCFFLSVLPCPSSALVKSLT
jgi:hypothetical protein